MKLLFRASCGALLLLALVLMSHTTPLSVATSEARPRPTSTPAAGQAAPAARPTLIPTFAPPTPAPEQVAAEQPQANQPAIAEQRSVRQVGVPPIVSETPIPLPLSHRFTAQEDDIVTRVQPGVYHIQRSTYDPLIINVLLFDLTAPQFSLKTALGDGWFSGRTRTSYMARQYNALAGINGDLFAGQGKPQGLTIVDSRVAIPPKHRATFAWSPEKGPFIGYFTNSWTWDAHIVAANGQRVLLNEYNYTCQPDHICLYNEFSRVVPYTWGDVKVLLGPSGRVFDITEDEAMTVSAGMRVLQGIGEGAEWLLDNVELGDTVTLDIRTTEPLTSYTQAISGGPIILKEGQFYQDCLCKLFDCSQVYFPDPDDAEDMLCEDFDTYWKESHYEWVYMPRTGIGYDKARQTLIVAVVDGYQPGFSRGMLQEEFADLFLEFGASTAMELDGGGSTTMVLEDAIVNNPSDETGERYVANGLLFFWNDYTPDLRYPAALQPPAWNNPALRPQ